MNQDKRGWISLHRKFRESYFYKHSHAVHVWIECLLRASHNERFSTIGRKKVTLKPGTFIMGRKELGQAIGMPPSTAWYWMQQFKVDKMVDIQSMHNGSLVTVLNWVEYQDLDTKVVRKKTAKRPQKDTIYNNYNNINNSNKDLAKTSKAKKQSYGESGLIKMTTEEYTKLCTSFGGVAIDKFIVRMDDYVGATGKKYKDYYRALRMWIKRDIEKKEFQVDPVNFRPKDFATREEFSDKVNSIG